MNVSEGGQLVLQHVKILRISEVIYFQWWEKFYLMHTTNIMNIINFGSSDN